MNQQPTRNHEDIGKLILRVALGGMLLLHGISKVLAGNGFVLSVVAKAGLPSALAYGVYVGEIIAPLMIIFGIYVRAAAGIAVINMVVAVLLVHTSQFFTLGATGGWALELQGLYFTAALVLVFLGAGSYAVQKERPIKA